MIERIIGACVKNRVMVFIAVGALACWGFWAMLHTPLDAVPDISDVQVIISTEWVGRSPDLIEDQVTYPIVTALLSAPAVRTVRGFTEFGISYVYVIFDDGTDIYWARSRVVEYLQGVRGRLPEGVDPTIGPDATGVGWVFEYSLVDRTGEHSLADLRSLQDWHLRYALAAVPGVAEVATIGGFVKQYQVSLDPTRLAAYDLSIRDVVGAIRESNGDVEGRLLEFAGREYMVRGRGYLRSVQDLEMVSLGATPSGTPILVRDIARVALGPDLRRGAADLDGKGEVVGGIVVMRFGENALTVIDRVKAKLADVKASLPAGVEIVTTYDRSQLVGESVATLGRALIEEAIVVSLVIVLFLVHLRSAVIPILTLPLAVVISFIPMYHLGVTSNIMSLGGLALAIGVLVDAAIVMVENAYRRVSEPGPDGRPVPYGAQPAAVAAAAQQVGRAIFFSLAIIVISFTPVFLLEAQEGRMFRPLAFSKTFAMVAASLLSITLVPVLMTVFIRGRRLRPESRNPAARATAAIYEPVIRFVLRWRWAALAVNALAIPAALVFLWAPSPATGQKLGSEFMPPLYEGALLYMPTAPPGLSITDATRMMQVQDRLLRAFPEVDLVHGTVGRATTATDNSPMGMVNTTILLKPRDQWRPGVTFQGLQAEMDAALQLPGFQNVWTQPIRNRLDMLSTGIKTPVGVKVLGSNLDVIQQLGRELERVLAAVPGTRSVYAERVAQGYFTDIQVDRAAIARHGLTVGDVQAVIQAALGGSTITTSVEGRERYPVNVRYQRGFREDLPDLRQIRVRTPAGAHVPLGQLATIELASGPAMIRDEDGRLAGYVYVDTDGRDLGGYVDRAREAVRGQIPVPAGYTLEWTGQYEYQVRARDRLSVLLPVVFLAIFVLLYLTFRSASEALIVMLSVPYAMTGGVFLQWWLGYDFSVAVWVGYIALYGVAVQTGVVMVVYLHEALNHRLAEARDFGPRDLLEATVAGAVLRLRPKLMTVSVVIAGLAPIMWSTGVGTDVMKPIAAPILGGMVTSAIHVLVITPVIFYVMKRRELRAGRLGPSALA